MGVYIKGMEMPTDGEAVVLVISNENGKTLAEVDEYCGAVYEAIPVPAHGRLIDADALIEKLRETSKRVFGSGDIPECSSLSIVGDYVESAPTIIPAEEDMA